MQQLLTFRADGGTERSRGYGEKKSGALNLFKQSLTMSQSMSAICCL